MLASGVDQIVSTPTYNVHALLRNCYEGQD